MKYTNEFKIMIRFYILLLSATKLKVESYGKDLKHFGCR